MSEKEPARIQVTKAELPLGPNQPVAEFTRELREALKPHFEKALKVKFESTETKSAYFYTQDIFADHVVVEVHQWAKGKSSKDTYYMVPYSRGPAGFVFGPPVEVVKEIRYTPKTPVTKRVEPTGALWANIL